MKWTEAEEYYLNPKSFSSYYSPNRSGVPNFHLKYKQLIQLFITIDVFLTLSLYNKSEERFGGENGSQEVIVIIDGK